MSISKLQYHVSTAKEDEYIDEYGELDDKEKRFFRKYDFDRGEEVCGKLKPSWLKK